MRWFRLLGTVLVLVLATAACGRAGDATRSDAEAGPARSEDADATDSGDAGSENEGAPGSIDRGVAPAPDDGEPLETGELRILRDLGNIGTLTFRFIPEDAEDPATAWELLVSGQRIPLAGVAQADQDRLLVVEDMNFDGLPDFRVLTDLPAGPNLPYQYFIWNGVSKRFEVNEALGAITSPQFVAGEIRSFWRDGAATWGNDTYVWDPHTSAPVLIREETWDAGDAEILETYGEGYARYRMTEVDPETGEETFTVDQAEMVE